MEHPEIPLSWKDKPTTEAAILDSTDPVYKKHIQNQDTKFICTSKQALSITKQLASQHLSQTTSSNQPKPDYSISPPPHKKSSKNKSKQAWLELLENDASFSMKKKKVTNYDDETRAQ